MKSFFEFILLTLYCAFVGVFASYLYNDSVYLGVERELNASRFNIVDDEGRNVAALGSFDDIDDIDEKGKVVSITGLVVFDQQGNTRFMSGINNVEDSPIIGLTDSSEAVKMLLHLDKEDSPKILLSKESHAPKLILYADELGAGINLYDDSGVGRVSVFEYMNNAGIKIFDKDGKEYWLKSSE